MNYAIQINRLPDEPTLNAALEYLCTTSNSLYNSTVYLARQLYFKANKFSNGRWLSSEMKDNFHFKALYASSAQQTCINVGEAFKGFRELLKLWWRGELEDKPRPPNYRRSGGMYQITYPKKWLRLVNDRVRVPMGTSCSVWFKLPEIFVTFPSNLDWGEVKELQIVPRAGYFDAIWVCEGQKPEPVDLDPDQTLAIDHGIDNWLTCVDSLDNSFIVDGKQLKAINQGYNKQVANIKQGKVGDFWCRLLDRITCKRNRQMRDAVNKAARMVIFTARVGSRESN
jgi:putative transposase